MVRSLTNALRLFFLSIAVIGGVLVGQSLAAELPAIELLAEAQVIDSQIRLADVAVVTASSEWIDRLEGIVVGSSPVLGATRRLTAPQIEVRLRQAGIHPSEVFLTGVSEVQVERVRALPESAVDDGEIANTSDSSTATEQDPEDATGAESQPLEAPPGWELQEIVTAVRDISQGDVLQPEDLQTEIVEVRTPYRDAGTVDDFIGKQATRSVRAGSRLSTNGVQTPPLIARGDRIWIRASAGGVVVQAPGTARETGGLGDTILVINDVSGQRLQATIVDAETVEVPLKGAVTQ